MKSIFPLLSLCLWLAAAPASAHDFWAGVEKAEAGRPLVVKIGFGHNFPAGEEIPAEDMERYEPLKLLGPNGEIKLLPGAAPRLAVTEKALKPGVYLLLAAAKPGFASRGPEGFQRRPKNEVPGATGCSFGAALGKAVIQVGPPAGAGFITQPVDQTLEIVPLADPAAVKVGEKFPVQVRLKGQPLGRARLEATFAGFAEGQAWAFAGAADEEGRLDIVPLRPGQWLAKAAYDKPYSDPAVCDRERYSATLTFTITD